MRHRVDKNRLSRNSSHRKAMMRNLVTSLIEYERISTTLARARELKKLSDKMITLAKDFDLSARRRASGIINKKEAVSKLFIDLAPRFKNRIGGYTRLLKIGFRPGDAAPLAIVEYVDYDRTKVQSLAKFKGLRTPLSPPV